MMTILVSVFSLSGCSKGKTSVSGVSSSKPAAPSENTKHQAVSAESYFIEPESFFVLDYSPAPEEKKNQPDKSQAAVKDSGSRNISQSIIPGLRKTGEYITAYNAVKAEISGGYSPEENESADENETSAGTFSVSDWGPKDVIPAEVKRPAFYVLFSEPVIPISTVGSRTDVSPYMQVTPHIKGYFRWYGTRLLCYEAEEQLNPLEEYNITVFKDIKSANGKTFSGTEVFKTTAYPLEIKWIKPGYNYAKQKHVYINPDDVPTEAAKEVLIKLNYEMEIEKLSKVLTVSGGKKSSKKNSKLDFTLSKPEDADDKSIFLCRITSTLSDEMQINLRLNESEKTYRTLKPFSVTDVSAAPAYGRYDKPVEIVFSHPVNKNSLKDNIEIIPHTEITEENTEIYGNILKIFNLAADYNSTAKIIIKDKIKDIYNRPVTNSKTFSVTIPPAESKADFYGYGPSIIEAKNLTPVVFTYENIEENSSYLIKETDSPLKIEYSEPEVFNAEQKTLLKTKPRNKLITESIDLSPYLKNGTAHLKFESVVNVLSDKKTYPVKNIQTFQITDLGVSVRYSVNKTVVLVKSLSDGKPVKGAKVYLYNGIKHSVPEVSDGEFFSDGITDENGLAVLEYSPSAGASFFSQEDFMPAVLVEKKGDKITFLPQSHSPWKNNIYNTRSVSEAISLFQRLYIFSDRGLYKPGEKIRIKGIDRSQLFGSFIPYTGMYKLEITDSSWESPKVYYSAEGKTNKYGSFTGEYTLPADLTPGEYVIKYTRIQSENQPQNENLKNNAQISYFTVAHFERLNFETSLKLQESPLISGNNLTAELNASYLAGGLPGGASYTAACSREKSYFTPEAPEFSGYRFGPLINENYRSFVSETKGTLDNNGSAQLSFSTKIDGTDSTGRDFSSTENADAYPYSYTVNASVTDAANQQVSASEQILVHPASFYLGLTGDIVSSSFTAAGPVTVKYKVVLPDSSVLSAVSEEKQLALLTGSSKADSRKIKTELFRIEWNNEENPWQETYITESKAEQQLYASGDIQIKPEKPGMHMLRVSAKDAENRPVVTEINFYVTGNSDFVFQAKDTDVIKLTPEKPVYKPGEKAKILLESPIPAGDYLITTEREGIFTQELKSFSSSTAEIEIPVARNFIPKVYVSISSSTCRNSENAPKSFFGITELFITPESKTFSVEIKSEATAYLPGEEVEITLKATKNGKPLPDSEITLIAADKGVLNLIDYHIPNPVDFFYDRNNFPLCVYGGDNRNLLLKNNLQNSRKMFKTAALADYAVNGIAVEESAIASGLESPKKVRSTKNRRFDFSATACFETVMTDADGNAKVKFKMPDTQTAYRLTAVGINEELLAYEETELKAQSPLNIQPVVPQVLRERDTAEAGLLLTNMSNKKTDVTVYMYFEQPYNEKSEASAFIDGEEYHTITIESGSTAAVYFDVAAEKEGRINAVFSVESDLVTEDISVPFTIEKPSVMETFTTTGMIPADENSIQETVIIPPLYGSKDGSFSITLDATRTGLLGDALKYEMDYPFLNTEQNISKLLSMLYFEKQPEVFKETYTSSNIKKIVSEELENLSKKQLKDGGFAYWAESTSSNPLVSARAAELFCTAEKAGYILNANLNKTKLVNYLAEAFRQSWKADNKNDISFYINYVLSLYSKKAFTDNEINSFKNDSSLSVSQLALLGLAELEKHGNSAPNAVFFANRIRQLLRPTTRGIDITDGHNDKTSRAEQYALTIILFNKLDYKDPLISNLLFSLFENQKKGFWSNTRTTSIVLKAFHELIEYNRLTSVDMSAIAVLETTSVIQTTFSGFDAKPVTEKLLFTDEKLKGIMVGSKLPLLISKTGDFPLYYTASISYSLPNELQSQKDEGLGVFLSIFDDATNEEITFKNADSSVMELESGKTYRMEVKLSTNRDRNFTAVRVPVPSGAEILNSTFVTTSPDYRKTVTGSPVSKVIYNNEIQFFYDTMYNGYVTASFRFRAVRRGVYPTPSVTAECMYEPEIFGRTDGCLYTIK